MPLHAYVHIVESPSAGDLLYRRGEGNALSEHLRIAEIPHRYLLATTRDTFVKALTRMIDDEIDGGFERYPVVHISAHGNTEGIGLTDGTMLEWHELREILEPITARMKGWLLVCLSSCEGYNGVRMAMRAEDQHVFWNLVGCAADVAWEDAAIAYSVFYHQLFKLDLVNNAALERCAECMRIASGEHRFQIAHGANVRNDFISYMAEHDRTEQATPQLSGAETP